MEVVSWKNDEKLSGAGSKISLEGQVKLAAYRTLKRKGRGRFLNFAWGRGDEITVFSSKPKAHLRREHSAGTVNADRSNGNGMNEEENINGSIASLSWDQTPGETGKMVREGHRTFMQLQKHFLKSLSPESVESQENGILLEASKHMRHCMDDALSQIENRLDPDVAAVGMDELSSYCDKMKIGSQCWHLCEILLLEQCNFVGIPLVKWVYRHFPRLYPEVEKDYEMDIQVNGSKSIHFWNVINGKILRGDTRGAWNYLKLDAKYTICKQTTSNRSGNVHDSAYASYMNDIKNVLLSMPRIESSLYGDEGIQFDNPEEEEIWNDAFMHVDISVSEYNKRFLLWNQKVINLSEDHQINDENLSNLIGLLRGDIDLLTVILDDENVDCWAHVFAACLLYRAPTTKKNELVELVERCIEYRYPGSPEEKELLLATFDGNFTKMLQLVHTIIGDRWLSAHLCEVVARTGAVESVQTSVQIASKYIVETDFLLGSLEVDMREYFILEYATQLALKSRKSHSAANWHCALDYLRTLDRKIIAPAVALDTPVYQPLGFLYAHLIIEKQYPITDRFVTKLVNGCLKVGLTDLSKSILRQRVMYWWCLGGGRTKFIDGRSIEKKDSDVLTLGFMGASNALLWSQKAGEHISNSLLTLLFEQGSTTALKMLVDHLSIGSGLPHNISSNKMNALDDAAMVFLSEYKSMRQTLKQASDALQMYNSINQGNLNENSENPELYLGVALAKRDNAAKKLVAMLRWHKVPERFWGALMCDILLWETNGSSDTLQTVLRNPISLTIDECSVLINTLEQLEYAYEKMAHKNACDLDSDTLASMRVMLLQAMARGVVSTGVLHS